MRYVKRPLKAYADTEYWNECEYTRQVPTSSCYEVFEEYEETFTGLYSSEGYEIHREVIKHKIGFMRE